MKVKLIHLLTDVNNYREVASVASLKQLDVDYQQMVNPLFIGEVPKEKCRNPDIVGTLVGPGTWGCFQAHRKAVENHDPQADYLLVCECDCILNVTPKRFMEAVKHCGQRMIERHMLALYVGGHGAPGGLVWDSFYFSKQSADAHCVLYPVKTIGQIVHLFETEKWWPFDLWLSDLLQNKIAVTKTRFASQIAGKSLVDGSFKGKELGRVALPNHPVVV
jgi:hypothetical protein